MGKVGTASVMILVAAASAVTTAVVYRPDQAAGPEQPGKPTSWAEWCGLSESDRAAQLQLYRTIAQRPDAEEVWRRARRFAALSDAERKRLGTVYAAMREVLDRLPSSRQAALRSLPEAARADAVYQILQTEGPERLTQLRQRLGARP
jgi:hypothetical protein